MSAQLYAIRRKADGAFFPIKAGSRENSWIEFPPIGEPAQLPPRTFTRIGAAKACLTQWLKGPLVQESKPAQTFHISADYEFDYVEPTRYIHVHKPERGTAADYEVIPVSLVETAPKLL